MATACTTNNSKKQFRKFRVIEMKLKTQICNDFQQFPTNGNVSAKSEKREKNKFAINSLSCVHWSGNEEIYCVGDDHQIYKWSSVSRETVEVAKLPDDFIPTDVHWLFLGGKSNSGGGKGGDSLLISSNDGRFVILNKRSRVERSISAHSLAITSARWSPDGAGLLTASEDGIIKIWSRSGMLRSTVVQSEEPIQCARWSPNSASIVFSQGGSISIKPLMANSKLTRWRAHDGLVLCLSCSSQNDLIASGGEDFRFKVWDSQGANLFTSSADEHAITAIAFNPENDILVVGTFNALKLCSIYGWTHSVTRFNDSAVGSFYGLSWSPDGTQIACGTATGTLIVGYVVEKQIIAKNLKATTVGRNSIRLQDMFENTADILEFADRIINFKVGYGHLIVATPKQLHIYNEKHINTPIIVDGRPDVRLIEVGKKFFIVVDTNSIWVYSYIGRLHLNPRYPGCQAQIPLLTWKCISLGLDMLTVRDNSDPSVVHIFDLIPGASRLYEPNTLRLKSTITEIASSRAGGSPEDQFVVLLDINRELFIAGTKNPTAEIYKIGTQVTAIKWGSETNILVGLHDACYSIWFCPGEAASDPSIIALTTVTFETAEFGKNITIESFEDAIVSFRCSGGLFAVNVNIFCDALHRALMDGQWQKALKICRKANNTNLWATLAAIATRKNQLDISEEAYCAALQIDKVCYLQYIKSLPASSPEYLAENSLMLGHLIEAETILLHNQKFSEAVELCLRMHNWKRALEIAEKYQIELKDFILDQRKKYLVALEKSESEECFLTLASHQNR